MIDEIKYPILVDHRLGHDGQRLRAPGLPVIDCQPLGVAPKVSGRNPQRVRQRGQNLLSGITRAALVVVELLGRYAHLARKLFLTHSTQDAQLFDIHIFYVSFLTNLY